MDNVEYPSFYDLSWKISEEDYHNYPAISYSTLARYDREGFSCIKDLDKKEDTKSLRWGSLIDSLMTSHDDQGRPLPDPLQAFYSGYFVCKAPEPPESVKLVIQSLLASKQYSSVNDIDRNDILSACEQEGYQSRWKDETKVLKILEYQDFISECIESNGKQKISVEDFQDAIYIKSSLDTNPLTSVIFNRLYTYDEEVFFQPKFKVTFEELGFEVKGMMDIVKVNHVEKKIYLYDLKTSKDPEYDFSGKYLYWRYWIQAYLYKKIVEKIISNDDYFKDFSVEEMIFVVVNRERKAPLLWLNFVNDDLLKDGDVLVSCKDEQFRIKHPFDLAKELYLYKNLYVQNPNTPHVPNGVKTTSVNNIKDFITIE